MPKTLKERKSTAVDAVMVDVSEAAAGATATASFSKHDERIEIEEGNDVLNETERKPEDKKQPAELNAALQQLFSSAVSDTDNLDGHPAPTAKNGDESEKVITRLSEAEEKELEEEETKIQKGGRTFVEVGWALVSIRNRNLYRQEFATFEEYLEKRWDFTKQRGSQLMQAATGYRTLSESMGGADKLPTNERAMRELLKVPEDKRADVLGLVTADGAATSDRIIKAREKVMPKRGKKTAAKKQRIPTWEKAHAGASVFAIFLTSCEKDKLTPEQLKALKEVQRQIEDGVKKLKLAA